MHEGHIVFSPVSHGHAIATTNNLPKSWPYWKASCEAFIAICDKVIVLMVDGWQRSEGVQAEIEMAERIGKLVEYRSTLD